MIRVERISAEKNIFGHKAHTMFFRGEALIGAKDEGEPVKLIKPVHPYRTYYLSTKQYYRMYGAAMWEGDKRALDLLDHHTTLLDDGKYQVTQYA